MYQVPLEGRNTAISARPSPVKSAATGMSPFWPYAIVVVRVTVAAVVALGATTAPTAANVGACAEALVADRLRLVNRLAPPTATAASKSATQRYCTIHDDPPIRARGPFRFRAAPSADKCERRASRYAANRSAVPATHWSAAVPLRWLRVEPIEWPRVGRTARSTGTTTAPSSVPPQDPVDGPPHCRQGGLRLWVHPLHQRQGTRTAPLRAPM